ncbi:hypothetical protein BDQ17DRAFT_1328480 [Cyathus striatus]|nr:hypothetical protein BDQ17DRAFT_1328480 [Cyathus striatus]
MYTSPQPQPQPQQPIAGRMSPASRYNHNLKVLRRRDPSIISIFDQFSHVCLYHHNGNKWEKQGYEGTMFLYERNAYPPYGFYILNRVGMDDHVQRIYPEDIVTSTGSYCIIKSFPDFSASRMKAILPADKFSSVYSVPDMPNLAATERSTVIGLWCFATSEREPLIPVMQRLHTYIKQNLPYPEKFRYGPGKPPPPNPNAVSSRPHRDINSDASAQSDSEYHSSANESSPNISKNGNSELDKLFAKLQPASGSAASTISTTSSSNMQSNGGKVTLESLFASVQCNMETHKTAAVVEKTETPSKQATGISLLDTIFASASTTTIPASSNQPVMNPLASLFSQHQPQSFTTQTQTQPQYQPQPQTQHQRQSSRPSNEHQAIHSPTPTSHHPQILNQDVISTLLGFPPSRAPSAASHPSSREGDNEGVSDGDEVSSPEAERSHGHFLATNGNGHMQNGFYYSPMPKAKLNGDVTPRPPYPPSTNTPPQLLSQQKPRPGRPLVPFEPNSELWPYPRAPLDDSEGEIVELDFADTSALSDVEAWKVKAAGSAKAAKGKKGKTRKERDMEEKAQIERSWDPVVKTEEGSSSPEPQHTTVLVQGHAGGPLQRSVITPPGQKVPQMQEMPTPKGAANGTRHLRKVVSPGGLDADVARESVVHTVQGGKKLPSGLEKNEFVRELLTLIHTDKSFVDGLWRDYTTRSG